MVKFSRIPGLGRIVRRFHLAVDKRVDIRMEAHISQVRAEIEALRSELWSVRVPIESHISGLLVDDIPRLSAQLSGLEARFADHLAEAPSRVSVGEAKPLEERVEVELRRVRTRMAAMSHYEERLRVLEESLPS